MSSLKSSNGDLPDMQMMTMINSVDNRLSRLEVRTEAISSQTAEIHSHTAALGPSVQSAYKVLEEIKGAFVSHNRYLLAILLVMAFALAIGFVMALSALTKTNASFSGFGTSAQVGNQK